MISNALSIPDVIISMKEMYSLTGAKGGKEVDKWGGVLGKRVIVLT
jgi:hypothetical protein